ncbi:MAG: hypothetical protein JWO08_4642 [Verrucomicrobiaceae bacterium]|nr:hypothetical protein [Verrucomicrobiaceae bacterium]
MFSKQPFDWRKELRRLPSAWHLLLLQAAALLASLLLFLALAFWSIRRDLTNASRERMQEELVELGALYNYGGLPVLRVAAAAQSDEAHHRIVRVTNADGEPLIESQVPEKNDDVWRKLVPFYLVAGEADWHILAVPQQGGKLVVGRIGLADGNRLWYARADGEELVAAGAATHGLLIMGALSSMFGLVPLLWFVQKVLQPLRTLIRGAHRLAAGSGTARLSAPDAIPELTEFAQEFNTSLDRIATLTGELHSVNEHLAHELRTPLARIRGNLENLLDHCGSPEAEDAAVRGMEEIDRATQLVHSILSIRLGDTGTMRLHLELTSPFELICDLVQLYAPAAEDRGLTIEYDTESDALVLLDRQRVRQVVTNLLDNALAYTPTGGHITLLQKVDGDGFLLRVQDTGPGLTAKDEQNIWRRFARGSAASAKTPGTGIGLALVRAVANAHFGEVGARNRPEGGAEFWVKLPLTPDVGEPLE